MKALETTVTVTPDGRATFQAPAGTGPGEHRALVMLDPPTKPSGIDWTRYPAFDAVPSDPKDTFRREDMYGDDGR